MLGTLHIRQMLLEMPDIAKRKYINHISFTVYGSHNVELSLLRCYIMDIRGDKRFIPELVLLKFPPLTGGIFQEGNTSAALPVFQLRQ